VSTPRALDNGVSEWMVVAPSDLGTGKEVLTASWKQGAMTSREELQVALVQGPAASASLSAPDPFVHLGGSIPVAATVKDAMDRPRPGARLALASELGDL